MTYHTSVELREALNHVDFTPRRTALRALASEALDSLTSADVRKAFEMSPLVGDGPKQISPRPTVSGLRDSLDEATLIALAARAMDAKHVLCAVSDPKVHGFASSASKTGWVFGRPNALTEEVLEEIITAQKEIAHMRKLNLSGYMLVITHLVNEGVSLEDARDTLKELGHDASVVDAAEAALRLQGETDEVAPMQTEHKAVFDSAMTALGGEAEPSTTEAPAYGMPDEDKAKLIDLTLAQAGLPSIAKMIAELNGASARIAEAEAKAKASAAVAMVSAPEEKAVGDMPKGKVRIAKAYDVFGLKRGKDAFDFDVPVWDWDGEHPHVPLADEDYVFRPFELMRVLYAIITNQRAYLHGHTGSGKTTFIEQVAARLCWPFMRINFDSEITRMDLIGRDVLSNEDGVTTSRFVDGILPQMMSGPYIGCFDELDFVRPDVAYVMQRALEGNGLMLTEDGGRVVKPHRMFRMFATGNTVGQGDEFGMYQGARPQSMALLDRFTVWIKVEYMGAADRKRLISSAVPSLGKDMTDQLSKYVEEHLEAFTTSKVLQPISPRSYIALGRAMVTFTQFFPESKREEAIKQAIETTVLDRASAQDRAVLKGIVDRVFK